MATLTNTIAGVSAAVRIYQTYLEARHGILENAESHAVQSELTKVDTEFSKQCSAENVSNLALAIAVDQHQTALHGGEYTWVDVLAARNLDHLLESSKFGAPFPEHPLELAAYDIVRAYYATKAH